MPPTPPLLHAAISRASVVEYVGCKLPNIPTTCSKWADDVEGPAFSTSGECIKGTAGGAREGLGMECPVWNQPSPPGWPLISLSLGKEKAEDQPPPLQILCHQGIASECVWDLEAHLALYTPAISLGVHTIPPLAKRTGFSWGSCCASRADLSSALDACPF